MGGWVGGLVGAWVIGGWKADGGMVSKCSQSAYLMKEQVCDLAAHFAFYRSAWLHILLSAGRPGDSYLPTLNTSFKNRSESVSVGLVN